MKEDYSYLMQKVEILIAQADDILKLQSMPKGFIDRNTFLNIKQRARFIAATYGKGCDDSLNRLLEVETKGKFISMTVTK